MTLRLIRGGSPDEPTGGDPVTEVLRHLDEEPSVAVPRIPRQRRSRGHLGVAEPRRDRTGRPGRPTAALLLVLFAALAAAAYFGLGRLDDRQIDRAQRQATAAAARACVDFVSVSAASVDRDLQRILAATTGDFREEFGRNRERVRAEVVANDVESRGTVLRAALLGGDRRRAAVLVAVDATVRTAKARDGRLSRYRIQVELVHTDGRWLVSRLRFVP